MLKRTLCPLDDKEEKMVDITRWNESDSQISVRAGEGFSVLTGALGFFSTKTSISHPTVHLLSFIPMQVELLHTL